MSKRKLCVLRNVDVIHSLHQIMQQNTVYYRSDFDVDSKILHEAAESAEAENKYLLWMSRPSGTWCFYERDVYLKGTAQNNAWLHYNHSSDRILAYAIHITGKSSDGVIYGNIYELDYAQHCNQVENLAVESNSAMVVYENGSKIIQKNKGMPIPDFKLGKFVRYINLPADEAAFTEMLHQKWLEYKKYIETSLEMHLNDLFEEATLMEAKRIVEAFISGHGLECNAHFCMTAISLWYTTIAETKEPSGPDKYGTLTWHKPLFATLPYSSATIMKEDDQPYVVIAKQETGKKRLRHITSD